MGLSEYNGWYDKQGLVYIYYTVEEVRQDLNCMNDKAMKTLAELDSAKGIGLIERVKQEQGKPPKSVSSGSPPSPCPGGAGAARTASGGRRVFGTPHHDFFHAGKSKKPR